MVKYVYILKAGEDHYKVGVALNVFKRTRTIQTGNAHHVYIVATKLCEKAEIVESKLHQKLASMSVGTGGKEWFRLAPEDVIRLCIMLNMEPEIDVYENTTLNSQLIEQQLRHKRLEQKIDTLINLSQVKNPAIHSLPKLEEKDSIIDIVQQKRAVQLAINKTLYQNAVEVVRAENKASTSLLQRKLRIGYGRAARLIEDMEANGVIGPMDGARPRKVMTLV